METSCSTFRARLRASGICSRSSRTSRRVADPTVPIAFVAGLVSFLSPCVLPLVPGYLSYMSGLGAADGSERRGARTAIVASSFVLGFTAVFVALGATATYLGSFLRDNQEVLT